MSKVLAGFRFSLWFLLAVFVMGSALAADQTDVGSQSVSFLISDAKVVPGEDAGWLPAAMPHRGLKPQGQDLLTYWYKASFNYDPGAEPLWLLLPKIRSGGKIYVNGIELYRLRESTADVQMHLRYPQLFFFPASALHAGKNEISIRMPTRDARNTFGGIRIGSEQEMRAAQAHLQLWDHKSHDVFSGAAMFIGLFICGVWIYRPKERTLGLFGLALVFWSLLTLFFRVTEIPIALFHLWVVTCYFMLCGFFATLTLSIIRYQGGNKRFAAKVLLVHWLGSSLIFLLSGNVAIPVIEIVWILGCLPMLAYAFVLSIQANLRGLSVDNSAISLSLLVLLLVMLHDFAARTGIFNFTESYRLHMAILFWLLTAGIVAMRRFTNLLKHAERFKQDFAFNIIDYDAAQGANYERQRESEQLHAVSNERQRIMREMHDGVGSHLLSTLVIAQRGGATQDEIVALLKECIDEMRLTIDSLSPTEPDLLSVLGNFRYRMESRFNALGIKLVWRNHDMPDELEMNAESGLQVLRILQEALTNVLKHAAAQTVEIDVHYTPKSMQIRIRDNGIGIDAAVRPGGKGLSNMQLRAVEIGAVFSVTNIETGTQVLLDIPITAQ